MWAKSGLRELELKEKLLEQVLLAEGLAQQRDLDLAVHRESQERGDPRRESPSAAARPPAMAAGGASTPTVGRTSSGAGATTPGGTVIRNKPIMIYLHANTEEYDPAACTSLLVNLGSLEGFHDVRPHPNAPRSSDALSAAFVGSCWTTAPRG